MLREPDSEVVAVVADACRTASSLSFGPGILRFLGNVRVGLESSASERWCPVHSKKSEKLSCSRSSPIKIFEKGTT
jgi:hypothetical protein